MKPHSDTPHAGGKPRAAMPAAWLWALAGMTASTAGVLAAAAGFFAWQGLFWVSGQESREIVLARPSAWGAILIALVFAALFARELAGDARSPSARVRARRLALQLGVWLLTLPPYAILLAGGVNAGAERAFFWRVGLGLAILAGLTATAHALLTSSRTWRPPVRLIGPRLWLLFFLCAHLPGLWLIRPWAPRFYQHRFIGGDEPEILLLTHSLAMDGDYNLYNNRLYNHRQKFLIPSEESLDGTAEDAARKAARFGAGAPQNTPEYWRQRRYNMYRPGLGLLLAPGYKLGFQWGKHHFYGVALTLALMLTISMVNLHALVLRATASRGAALLTALVAGLSPPLLFYSVSVYPDPLCAALLIFAVRVLYDAWRNRRDAGVRPSTGASAAFALSAAYLPAIHEKMFGFSALLLIAFFVLARPRWRGALTVLALVALSAALQSRYYRTVYGTWLPPYVHAEPFRLANLRQGALGLLLDRYRGLAPMTPWCWMGLAGLAVWLRRESAFAWLPAVLMIGFWIATGSFLGWYGGACPQPRYVTLILPLFGIGAGLLWAWRRSPGIRAALLGLGAMGILQGLGGLLFADQKLYRGGSLLGDLFPNYFTPSAAAALLGRGWLLLGAAGIAVLLSRAPRRLAWTLLGPLALIGWAAGAALDRAPAVRVHAGVTPELVRLLRDPGPMDNTFARRIKLYRWLRTAWPDIRRSVSSIPAELPAEHPDLRPLPGSVRNDPGAEGGACVRMDRERPRAGFYLLTFMEGRYRAEFRVRRESTEAVHGRLRIAATAGRSQSERLGFRDIDMGELPDSWTTLAVPFELTAPDRFIGAQAELEGDGAVSWDTLRWIWQPSR